MHSDSHRNAFARVWTHQETQSHNLQLRRTSLMHSLGMSICKQVGVCSIKPLALVFYACSLKGADLHGSDNAIDLSDAVVDYETVFPDGSTLERKHYRFTKSTMR